MGGHGERLSRKQEQAVLALLEHATLKQAAAAIKVNEKTLRGWLKIPAFQGEHRAARRRIVEEGITRLQQLTTGAVLALGRNLSCGIPGVEVRAAQAVLDRSLQAVELGDLLQRFEELEQWLGPPWKRPATPDTNHADPPGD